MTASITRPPWVQHLLDLLQQQCRLYELLIALGTRQRQVIDQGDTQSLLELLDQRQSLIDQLVTINAQLEPYKQDWPQRWALLDIECQDHVRDRMDQMQQLLDAILEADQTDRSTLTARRQAAAQGLGRLQQGSQVNRAYASSTPPSPRFTDRTG